MGLVQRRLRGGLVNDTGIGISEDLEERLFQRFSRGDSAAGRRYGGAGLGLAICKELAEGMGGRIRVSSRGSGGSKFYFDLPLGRSESTGRLKASPPPTPSANLDFLRDRRILVVDDVPLNQFILEQFLKDAGGLVDLSVSGQDAVAKAVDTPYDLILMDINMPEMDGIEATRAIRAQPDASVAATPIVGVTASVLPSERQMYLAQGMNDVLAKPFTQRDLQAMLRRILTGDETRARTQNANTGGSLLDR